MLFCEIEVGQTYICDYGSTRYFATVRHKDTNGLWVTLSGLVNQDEDTSAPIDMLREFWVPIDHLHGTDPARGTRLLPHAYVGPPAAADDNCVVLLPLAAVDRLKAARGPRENYSDVIVRLAKGDGHQE